MAQLENELLALKSEVVNMWILVHSQLNKAREAMLNFDKDLAREVVMKEKRVNAQELKIDLDCENIFALYCPVAVDLRFLLAVLKINNNLERIGDIAEGIAKYVIEATSHFDEKVMEGMDLLRMYDDAIGILTDTRIAFEMEDTALARSIFKRDDVLDDINSHVNENVIRLVKEDMSIINEALYVGSIIRKLERVGDQSKNIAEEIIFYIEAKVLKHQKENK
jgi:phosphate transport system protein